MKKWVTLVLALICLLGLIGCTQQEEKIQSDNTLTLDKVIELSSKGEELTWSDFEQYAYEDIGSGLYIYRYDIDSNYELRIGGSPSVEPMYIRLVSKANQDNYIDIRTENVQDFIKSTE